MTFVVSSVFEFQAGEWVGAKYEFNTLIRENRQCHQRNTPPTKVRLFPRNYRIASLALGAGDMSANLSKDDLNLSNS